MHTDSVHIVGGGLTGPLLALLLARRGIPVELYERLPPPSARRSARARSINLALSTRGIFALQQVGLRERVLGTAHPMTGRLIHPEDGGLRYQPYGNAPSHVVHSLRRSELHGILLEAVQGSPEIRLHFRQHCLDVDPMAGTATFRDDAGRLRTVHGPVIAADGAKSAVRRALVRRGLVTAAEELFSYQYKELEVRPAPGGTASARAEVFHIWPRLAFMLVALPNRDGTLSGTLFLPREGRASFGALAGPGEAAAFLAGQFPDVEPGTLLRSYAGNPASDMVTVQCWPWAVEGDVLLIGDAAHAMTPFFGQGMNCCFEDCTVLDECIGDSPGDWKRIFHEYQLRRRPDAEAIVGLSAENLAEMSTAVTDRSFHRRKELEMLLAGQYPDSVVPTYAMVAFTRMSYSLARARARLQDRILAGLCEAAGDVARVDLPRAARMIRDGVARCEAEWEPVELAGQAELV